MQALLDLLQSSGTLYLPGASGEALASADEPQRIRGVSCLLAGFNLFDYAGLDPDARVTTFLLPAALRGSFETGRVRVLPLGYGGIAYFLRDRVENDVTVAHVATPNAAGPCSLGITAT